MSSYVVFRDYGTRLCDTGLSCKTPMVALVPGAQSLGRDHTTGGSFSQAKELLYGHDASQSLLVSKAAHDPPQMDGTSPDGKKNQVAVLDNAELVLLFSSRMFGTRFQ